MIYVNAVMGIAILLMTLVTLSILISGWWKG